MKRYAILLILAGILLLSGCGGQQVEKVASAPENNEANKQPTTQHPTNSQSQGNPSNKEVLDLVNEAFKRNWEVYMNYNPNQDAVFSLNGQAYMYLTEDIDTKEKLLAYLQEAYTQEISLTLLDSFGFKENDGRLYHLSGEMGTLMNWHKAQIQDIQVVDENTRVYKFQVPESDGYVERTVELKRTDGEQWKVDTVIDF